MTDDEKFDALVLAKVHFASRPKARGAGGHAQKYRKITGLQLPMERVSAIRAISKAMFDLTPQPPFDINGLEKFEPRNHEKVVYMNGNVEKANSYLDRGFVIITIYKSVPMLLIKRESEGLAFQKIRHYKAFDWLAFINGIQQENAVFYLDNSETASMDNLSKLLYYNGHIATFEL